MRIDRWILNPLRFILLIFCAQCAVWYFGMPENPILPGVAPRYVTPTALSRYFVLFVALLAGLSLGALLTGFLKRRSRNPIDQDVFLKRLKTLQNIALAAILLSILGEIFYIRSIIENPAILIEAYQEGLVTHVAQEVRGNRIVGLSSLNNLFIVPTTIYAMLTFNPHLAEAARRNFRKKLLVLGIVVAGHAMILSARMFMLYFLSIVLAAYLLSQRKGIFIKGHYVAAALILALLAIWGGETLRTGLYFSHQNMLSPFSFEAQQYVWLTLIQGYIASDFNNAMVILNNSPGMQLIATTGFKSFLDNPVGYHNLPDWVSAHGTVNILGLWWFDWGWFAPLVAITAGFWLGSTYALAKVGTLPAKWSTLFYLISFPAIFSAARINYFGQTIFILPLFFLCGCWLIGQLKKGWIWRSKSG